MALFWLILGLGLILIPGFDAWRIWGTQRIRDDGIRDNGLSIGWLALGLAAYNFVRWWLIYRRQATRREPSADESPPRRPREYNPEFDFTKDMPEQK